jgi:hypothetical protein
MISVWLLMSYWINEGLATIGFISPKIYLAQWLYLLSFFASLSHISITNQCNTACKSICKQQ